MISKLFLRRVCAPRDPSAQKLRSAGDASGSKRASGEPHDASPARSCPHSRNQALVAQSVAVGCEAVATPRWTPALASSMESKNVLPRESSKPLQSVIASAARSWSSVRNVEVPRTLPAARAAFASRAAHSAPASSRDLKFLRIRRPWSQPEILQEMTPLRFSNRVTSNELSGILGCHVNWQPR